MADDLTHFDDTGRARMVDVSGKGSSARRAAARGRVLFQPGSYEVVRKGGLAKGDVAKVAELAGIMGAKKTSDLIPLCHPLPLTSVSVRVEPDDEACAYVVTSEVKTTGKTGVEMEALTAVMVACLTVYDMAKAVDKSIVIEDVYLIEKSGGVSGPFSRHG
ncbi:MAG: cyclic pyranopterin monophosphate synthase MoaC [Parvularculaceae bacterium]